MPKSLTLLTFAALAAVPCATAVAAQTPSPQSPAAPAPEWAVVSPEGEGFTARMPKQPTRSEQAVKAAGLNASGRHYAAADGGATFAVWVMKGSHRATPLAAAGQRRAVFEGGAFYLDSVAEMAWELIVTPELKRLKREGAGRERVEEVGAGMTFLREFDLGGRPAREYSVRLEKERGLIYVSAGDARAYVVAALGADAPDGRLKQFLDSFALEGALTPRAAGGDAGGAAGGGLGPGRGTSAGGAAPPAAGGVPGGGSGEAAVDYTRPFRQGEVTKKVTVTYKPEPEFTEQARRFNVSGTVRLRAILAATGDVRNIVVVKGLPHGLTEKAIAAAVNVRFNPAQKDGRVVSQFVIFEYNFNIY